MSGARAVVKVGSGALAGADGELDAATMSRLAEEIARARADGHPVVLVSSGAILAGRRRLKLPLRPSTAHKQAAAAVGQSRLMRAWEEAFAPHAIAAAQVLLTREDLRDRARYLNARATLLTLLRLGALPIVNENDTVAVEEIRFGDNDGLAALVAGLVDARLLVLLTDQAGLYTDDPRARPDARLVARVRVGELPARVEGAGPWGSGGMASKVRAARQAAASGVATVVASGARPGALSDALAGRPVGTLFEPAPRRQAQRRQWLAFAAQPRGRVLVDAGARAALVGAGKSLLASGVRAVAGRFEAGETVSLVEGGVEFARGRVNYAARELELIAGLHSAQIPRVLGRAAGPEVVHRDHLAILPR